MLDKEQGEVSFVCDITTNSSGEKLLTLVKTRALPDGLVVVDKDAPIMILTLEDADKIQKKLSQVLADAR